MIIDPNTLNPDEIRTLPMRRDLPLNGLSEAQVRALGFDPVEIEAGRLAIRESAQQAHRAEEQQILAAGLAAVAEGAMLPAEVAHALHAGGFLNAHDAFVQNWQKEEAELLAESEAVDLSFIDANEYAQNFTQRQAQERAAQEAEVAELQRQLKTKQVENLQGDLKSFVESTPGAHRIAPTVERQLVADLQASGVLPSTPKERQEVIESALRKTAILSDAHESIRQQVDQEWRIHRKNNARNEGIVTAADVASAETRWKEERINQLTDAKMIDMNALRPGPTAEEITADTAERYRERQAKSTSFHEQVADIATRGKDAKATRDRGEGISDERARYREALARAEAEAQYGTVTTSLSEGTAQAVSAKPTGYGPDGTWPDELGPAL